MFNICRLRTGVVDLKIHETKDVLQLGLQMVSTSYKYGCRFFENLIEFVYVGKKLNGIARGIN